MAGSASGISEAVQQQQKGNEVVEEEEALAPLRALDAALLKRTIVKTSIVRLHDKDGTRASMCSVLNVDGSVVTDESTLQVLEESVSDVICSEHESLGSRESLAADRPLRTPGLLTDEEEEQAIGSCSGANLSAGHGGGSSFYSIPSCCSSFEGPVSADSLKKAEQVIADLEANGPAGLVHLSSLSAAIGKPIRVWSSGSQNGRMVGRSRIGGQPVDIEYHEAAAAAAVVGHWTLRNNEEPARDRQAQLNDCLFGVVADQVDCLAPELRRRTIERMRTHVGSLANRIEAIAEAEKCERIALLVGGARYNGKSAEDAEKVIDASQRGHCHPDGRSGHPRGHASHPEARGPTESVENYSRGGSRKSGFLSRQDQDALGHLVLDTQMARQAMQQLNAGGADSIAIRVSPSDLDSATLPNVAEYLNGQQQHLPRPFKQLVIVLRHHLDQNKNPDADVFVHTFYPIVS